MILAQRIFANANSQLIFPARNVATWVEILINAASLKGDAAVTVPLIIYCRNCKPESQFVKIQHAVSVDSPASGTLTECCKKSVCYLSKNLFNQRSILERDAAETAHSPLPKYRMSLIIKVLSRAGPMPLLKQANPP